MQPPEALWQWPRFLVSVVFFACSFLAWHRAGLAEGPKPTEGHRVVFCARKPQLSNRKSTICEPIHSPQLAWWLEILKWFGTCKHTNYINLCHITDFRERSTGFYRTSCFADLSIGFTNLFVASHSTPKPMLPRNTTPWLSVPAGFSHQFWLVTWQPVFSSRLSAWDQWIKSICCFDLWSMHLIHI